jgi:hypothetical protein
MLGGKLFFQIDARIAPTEEEAALIKKYGLGATSVYNSEATRKHATAAVTSMATGNMLGLAKGAIRAGMAHLTLSCTVDSLVKGQLIECKDMEELLAAESAIIEACNTTKAFIETAKTFDGRETVIEITAVA